MAMLDAVLSAVLGAVLDTILDAIPWLTNPLLFSGSTEMK